MNCLPTGVILSTALRTVMKRLARLASERPGSSESALTTTPVEYRGIGLNRMSVKYSLICGDRLSTLDSPSRRPAITLSVGLMMVPKVIDRSIIALACSCRSAV